MVGDALVLDSDDDLVQRVDAAGKRDLHRCRFPRIPSDLAAGLEHVCQLVVAGTLEVARQGYRVARSELGEAVPPHAVDSAFGAYRDEGRRLAAAVKGIEAVERALRGEPL